jgi:hypothetical protein
MATGEDLLDDRARPGGPEGRSEQFAALIGGQRWNPFCTRGLKVVSQIVKSNTASPWKSRCGKPSELTVSNTPTAATVRGAV